MPGVAFPPVGPLGLGFPTFPGTMLREDCHTARLRALRLSLAPRYLAHFGVCVVSLTGS